MRKLHLSANSLGAAAFYPFAVVASAVLALSGPARAAAPEMGVITFNVANSGTNGDDAAQVASGTVSTLAGDIPSGAWINSQGENSETKRNGSYAAGSSSIVSWTGSAAAALGGLSVAWKVDGSAVNNYCRNTSASPDFQRCWLARGDGSTHDSEPAVIDFTGIPYSNYDVIVYLSGGASRTAGEAFRAVKVGDNYYVGDSGDSSEYKTVAATDADQKWGTRQDTLAYGANAIRVKGLSGSSLTLRMEKPGCGSILTTQAQSQGISAVQIVERAGAIAVSRTVAADDSVSWSDSLWTVDGTPGSTFSPLAGEVYNVTVTVGGDCTITMPGSIGSFDGCSVNFALAENVEAATVSLKYGGTLPADPADTLVLNPFGFASVTADTGVTLSPGIDCDAANYLLSPSGTNLYVARRPEIGVISVRIGARAQNASSGYIDPAYSAVGPYPMSGLFWEHTKFWNNNSTDGTYTDIQNLTDAKDGSSAIRIGYYGHNTYYNNSSSNDASTPNQVLTKTYLDDSSSGNVDLTATASAGGETITLPAPGHIRGWQLHFENIPYNAYDVYFVTASDVVGGSLKECPIYVSLDGGTSWKSYVGDSVNEKTVMGTENWTGLPFAQNGVLVQGKNYLKMRITKSIYGDNIGTIDITHGRRNTESDIRSGLAAIQIVEVANDGVYTLGESGSWSDAIWNVGELTEQSWTDTVEGEPSIAKIVASETISSVTVDAPVSAGSVILSGTGPFTVAGSETLTVATGFDASGFTGELNLQSPIAGTIYIGTGTTLEFGGDGNMTLPAYTIDGAGAWTKIGTGKLTVNSSFAIAGTVTEGTLEIASNYAGNLSLAGGDLAFAGSAGEGASEIVYSGAATLAQNAAGKTTIASGVVQSRGSIATDIDVAEGATLKLGAVGALGSTDNGAAASGKKVLVAGTVELNGMEGCNAYTLSGGTLQNTGSAIGIDKRQTMSLTLADNSTVHSGANFGLINTGHGVTTLNLDGHTLTKTGSAKFWLDNTRSTQSGTIDIQTGSVDAYRTVSLPNVTFNIAEGAALKVRTGNFSVKELTGNGTVSVGQDRPIPTLDFAAGSELTLEVVLSSTTESRIEIPYTGTPKSVKVIGTDWETEDRTASVIYEDGKIIVTVDVAKATWDNPVVDGDTATFTYVFDGKTDAQWETTDNWYSVSGNRKSDYTGETAPNLSGAYSPVVFDGDLIGYPAGEDGYKSVTCQTRVEGWNFKIGLFNHVHVTIDKLNKLQNGCWAMVDDSSRLTVAGKNGDGVCDNEVKLYVAAADGVVFQSNYPFESTGHINTFKYYLKGEGSIKFEQGVTTGSHELKQVILPAGNYRSGLKKLITRKLVSFGSRTDGNATFTLSGATVASLDTTLAMTAFEATEETPVLTKDAAFGTYELSQKSDGIYITYVGYDKPFSVRMK